MIEITGHGTKSGTAFLHQHPNEGLRPHSVAELPGLGCEDSR